VGKIPEIKRTFVDLLPAFLSRGGRIIFGTALAGLGWLGPTDALAPAPTAPSPPLPTVSSVEDRQRKWPKLVLKLNAFAERIVALHASHASHSSHSSHASHSSHVSHYSGASAPQAAPSPSPSPSPSSSASPSPSPSPSPTSVAASPVSIVITEIDKARRVMKGRNSTGASLEFQLRDDTMIGGGLAAAQRLDEYTETHQGSMPFSLSQKVLVIWKRSLGKQIAVRIQTQ
jgi:hypothetical protein